MTHIARALALCASTALACGGVTSGGADLGAATMCPSKLPTACPTPAPSFATTVDAVITDRCVPCHNPNGLASDRPFANYNDIYALRASILSQVYNCEMPPADAGVLPSDDRETLLNWLVCNAPNN